MVHLQLLGVIVGIEYDVVMLGQIRILGFDMLVADSGL